VRAGITIESMRGAGGYVYLPTRPGAESAPAQVTVADREIFMATPSKTFFLLIGINVSYMNL
jgi:hypothetical protein